MNWDGFGHIWEGIGVNVGWIWDSIGHGSG